MVGRPRIILFTVAAAILFASLACALIIYRIAEDQRGMRLAVDGYSAFEDGDYDIALKNYNASLTHWMSETHRGHVYSGRSGVYAITRNFDAAIRDLTEAIKRLPNTPENFANRGGVYLLKGDTDRAIADYSRAVALNPNYAGVFFKRSKIFLDRGNLEAALADINEAVRSAPDNPEALVQRGLIYERRKDWANALASLQSAEEIDPTDTFEQREYTEKLIAHVLLERGLVAEREKRFDDAIALYTDALKHHPTRDDHRTILCDRGNAYGRSAQLERATQDYNEAIRLDPKFYRAYFNRGINYRDLGQTDKAIADYSEAIKLNSEFAEGYIDRAAGFFRRGEFARASADYDEAFRHIDKLDVSKRPELLNSLAWMRATSSKPALRNGKRAVQQATQSCEMTQWKNDQYIDTLAAAYAESGDFDRAEKIQLEAMRINGESGVDYKQMKERLELYQHHQPYHAPAKH